MPKLTKAHLQLPDGQILQITLGDTSGAKNRHFNACAGVYCDGFYLLSDLEKFDVDFTSLGR
nr:hypothetical protein [uncultured Cohaesibacter sp.]